MKRGMEKIGNVIYNYDECDNRDSECPSNCNHTGCMMFSPKVYRAE